MLIPLILSGGSATRLWPVSRKNLPKQFLELAGKGTLFQQAIARTRQLPDVAVPIVVASEDHRFLAADQLLEGDIKGATIVLEPLARNTAPAGFGLGIIEGFTKFFYAEASNVVIFVIMAIVLLLKPAGLFGTEK